MGLLAISEVRSSEPLASGESLEKMMQA